jgi:hypothetical protein
MGDTTEQPHTFAIRLHSRGPRDTYAIRRALIQLADDLGLRSDEGMTVQIVGRELRISLTPEGLKRLDGTSP